jgi:hypothetical protein
VVTGGPHYCKPTAAGLLRLHVRQYLRQPLVRHDRARFDRHLVEHPVATAFSAGTATMPRAGRSTTTAPAYSPRVAQQAFKLRAELVEQSSAASR